MAAAEKALTNRLARDEPKDWRPPASLTPIEYPEAWANEILPLAREAHSRLRYQNVRPKLDHENMIADGEVAEAPARDGLSYRKWSGQIVLREMHKAGWRLAYLLEKILPPNESGTAAAAPSPAL
jgi:hypothetical protein